MDITTSRAIHISGFERRDCDLYPTPAWVTGALLRNVTFRSPIWEPCCGDGSIAKVLEQGGHKVVATDLHDHSYGTPNTDFFQCPALPPGCRALITNPPYGDGQAAKPGRWASPSALLSFVKHVLHVIEPCQGQAALLVRLQWITGKRAAALLQSGPLESVIMLTDRIQWFDHGEKTNRGQHNHVWVVFDHLRAKGAPPKLIFAGAEGISEDRRCIVCGVGLPVAAVSRTKVCSAGCRIRYRAAQESG